MDRKKWSEKDYLDLEKIEPDFPQKLIDDFFIVVLIDIKQLGRIDT